MFHIIAAALLGMNLAPFVFMNLNIWHAQGFWVQACIGIMFSWSFIEKPKRIPKRNMPLGLLHLWVAASVAFICFQGQVVGRYDIIHFFPYFNFLCLLIFYKFIVQYLTIKHIEWILTGLKYAVIFNLLLCVLQKFGFSQVFSLISTHHTHNNMVTGVLGNGTHLSGFLGSCVPLFFWKMKREDILSLVLLSLVLLFTGTTIGDPSISGFIIGIALFFFFYKNKIYLVSLLGILLICCFILAYPYIPKIFFSLQGRIEIWSNYIDIIKTYFVSGIGLGGYSVIRTIMLQKSIYTNTVQATHLHLEYLEFLLELGLIGIILIVNVIKSFLQDKAETRTQLVLKSMGIGFLISCCFNFPAHLWLPSTIAMFAYASYQIKE